MLYVVVLSLLAQLVAALRFGKLLRRDALDYAVKQASSSEVSIVGQTYTAWLELKSDTLTVPYLNDMQVLVISTTQGMIPFENMDECKVQPGDALVIYKSGAINPNVECQDLTAERLSFWVKSLASATIVFGVTIKKDLGANQMNMSPVKAYGLSPVFFKGPASAKLDCLQSNVKVFVDEQCYADLYLRANGRFVVWSDNRVKGMVGIIRDNVMVGQMSINFRRPFVEYVNGDLAIMAVTEMGKDIMRNQMEKLAKDFINEGEDAFNANEYSEVTIFVAKIEQAVNYLEEITTVGGGTVESASFNAARGRPTWSFDGAKMIIQNSQSVALHVIKNENPEEDFYGEKLLFNSERVELAGLGPGDIVAIIVNPNYETDIVDPILFKKALSDCTNASELKIKLKGLQSQSGPEIMAAIVSDKIGLARSPKIEPMEEEGVGFIWSCRSNTSK